MKLFDLHCDTLFELDARELSLQNSSLAISLENMEKYDTEQAKNTQTHSTAQISK